ncbi:unnamed protein product [Caenorhabditis angaria]|uniref:Uncharacterized protein n=1 Tax=Caenorhabditis angaria TaxID=860376 RepID=A0A9P1N165_9PELO|nr:unnamed protein product [Caenorhabditis angaria]
MVKLLVFFTIFLIVCVNADVPHLVVNAGENLEINLWGQKELTRSLGPNQPLEVYRVCDGKNAKTCGYWENKDTKKKVAKAPVTKIDGNNLILQKVTGADSGNYYGGDIYMSVTVLDIVQRAP